MSTFILIHGAWHGAWCWYKVVPLLRRAGHEVIAPDLPSLGRDATPVDQVSLASWTEHLCQVVDALPGPVILVGHSRGGLLLSTIAERRPVRVAHLVYVTAILMQDGETFAQLLAEDGTSLIIPNLVVSADGVSTTIRYEALKEVFYAECPEEDVTLARMLLKPEPRGPARTAIKVTTANLDPCPGRTSSACATERCI